MTTSSSPAPRIGYAPSRPEDPARRPLPLVWRGVRDSNSQPSDRQSVALPIAPTPRRYRDRNRYLSCGKLSWLNPCPFGVLVALECFARGTSASRVVSRVGAVLYRPRPLLRCLFFVALRAKNLAFGQFFASLFLGPAPNPTDTYF